MKKSIEDRLRELFIEGKSPKEASKIIMSEFDVKIDDFNGIMMSMIGKMEGLLVDKKQGPETEVEEEEDCDCNPPKYAFVVMGGHINRAEFKTADSIDDIKEYMSEYRIMDKVVVFKLDRELQVEMPITETVFND